MVRKSKYTPLQRIERNLRFSFSGMLSLMFSPNHTRPFSWWAIFGILELIGFMGYMVSISN